MFVSQTFQPQDLSPRRRALRSLPPVCPRGWTQDRTVARKRAGNPQEGLTLPQSWHHRLWVSGGWGLDLCHVFSRSLGFSVSLLHLNLPARPPMLRPKAGSDLDPLSLSPSILKTYTSPILSHFHPPLQCQPVLQGLPPSISLSLSF